MPEPAPTVSRPGGPPSRVARNLVIGAVAVLFALGITADIFWSVLLADHPLALIALNARNRYLTLASPEIGAWAFYTVGALRLILADPLFFLLGRWYGDSAIRWAEKRAPTYGMMLRSAETWFRRASYPLVAVAPNNFICLFAGASGMHPVAFLASNVIGTIARLYLLRVVGDVFGSPIDGFTDFVSEYRWPLVALSAVVAAFSLWSERRQGRGQMSGLADLDDEVADEAADDKGAP